MANELYHAGVKGMKWGVRKAVEGAKTTRRAMSAASIEEKIRNAKRVIDRHDSRSDRRTRTYKLKNAKYQAKLKRLESIRNKRVSDLSEADIDRGRAAYKTMKNVSMSVAVTAASLAVGTVSAPASIATKIVGAGISSALNGDLDN